MKKRLHFETRDEVSTFEMIHEYLGTHLLYDICILISAYSKYENGTVLSRITKYHEIFYMIRGDRWTVLQGLQYSLFKLPKNYVQDTIKVKHLASAPHCIYVHQSEEEHGTFWDLWLQTKLQFCHSFTP